MPDVAPMMRIFIYLTFVINVGHKVTKRHKNSPLAMSEKGMPRANVST